MRTRLLLLLFIFMPLVSCSDKETTDEQNIPEKSVWNSKNLAQTLWEGTVTLNGKEEKIVIFFESETEGYCYSNQDNKPSCLFGYSTGKNEVRFYNTYGDSGKLIINGSWHFLISEKKDIKLIQLKSEKERDYLILKNMN